jgi:hypothetical protein
MGELTEEWDFATFAITSQVHHRGNLDVMRTTLTQPYAVRDARRIANGQAVVVDPVALRPRRDPSQPAHPDDPADPREPTAFGAAGLVGSAFGLADADRVSFLLGVARQAEGADLDAFRLVAHFSGRRRCTVATDARSIAVLATPMRTSGAHVLLGNVTPDRFRGDVNGEPLTLAPYEVRAIDVRIPPAARRVEAPS